MREFESTTVFQNKQNEQTTWKDQETDSQSSKRGQENTTKEKAKVFKNDRRIHCREEIKLVACLQHQGQTEISLAMAMVEQACRR